MHYLSGVIVVVIVTVKTEELAERLVESVENCRNKLSPMLQYEHVMHERSSWSHCVAKNNKDGKRN